MQRAGVGLSFPTGCRLALGLGLVWGQVSLFMGPCPPGGGLHPSSLLGSPLTRKPSSVLHGGPRGHSHLGMSPPLSCCRKVPRKGTWAPWLHPNRLLPLPCKQALDAPTLSVAGGSPALPGGRSSGALGVGRAQEGRVVVKGGWALGPVSPRPRELQSPKAGGRVGKMLGQDGVSSSCLGGGGRRGGDPG